MITAKSSNFINICTMNIMYAYYYLQAPTCSSLSVVRIVFIYLHINYSWCIQDIFAHVHQFACVKLHQRQTGKNAKGKRKISSEAAKREKKVTTAKHPETKQHKRTLTLIR